MVEATVSHDMYMGWSIRIWANLISFKKSRISPEFPINAYHEPLVWFMSVVHDKYCTVLIALLDIQTITSLMLNKNT